MADEVTLGAFASLVLSCLGGEASLFERVIRGRERERVDGKESVFIQRFG
jgi:hypothetical protein